MIRKLLLTVSAVALGLGGVVVPTVDAYAAARIDAHGTLHCGIKGKVKVNPPLLFTGTGSATFTAKVASTTCTGTSGVTKVKGTLVATLPSSSCTALAAIAFPAANLGPIKWKGGAKYNASTVHFNSGGSFTVADPIALNLPGAGTSSVASGSFAGQNPTMILKFDQPAATFATNCLAKTKGMKGSGGLKKMSFSGASSLNIA